MPKCDFNKGALQLQFTIQIAIQHGCSPVNLRHIFRTPSPRNNTSGGLILHSLAFYAGNHSDNVILRRCSTELIFKKGLDLKTFFVVKLQAMLAFNSTIKIRSNPSDLFLGKDVLQICSEFTE